MAIQYPSERNLTAAIVPVGNEILSGRTLEKNANWIAGKLSDIGLSLRQIRVIPDEVDIIINTVRELSASHDFLITTGGIGPTHDDKTAQSVGKAFGQNLQISQEAQQILTDYYGKDNLNEGRLKMAYIPQGATLIPNPVSAAPGFRINNVFVLAGIPEIMKGMMSHVLEEIGTGVPFETRVIDCPYPESEISVHLETVQKTFPDIEIGSYPGRVNETYFLKIMLRGKNTSLLDQAESKIRKNLGL